VGIGKNLSVGNSYTYKICDPRAIQTSAANYHYFTQGNRNHNSSVCYVIKMDFVNLLNSDKNQINRDVWVVQAVISNYSPNRDGNDVRYTIFHVDAKTLEVRSDDTIHPDTIKYADSLQDTLQIIYRQIVTEPEEGEKLIIKGWQFVAVLPNDKVVLRQGSTQNVGGPDRSRVVTCL